MSQQDIIKLLSSPETKKYLASSGVEHLYLIGSYATGKENEQSDIDLMYEQGKDIGWEIIDIIQYLEEICKKKIDMVEKTYIREQIKHDVLSSYIAIF